MNKEVKRPTLKVITLMQDFEEETNKWKGILCSWIGKIKNVKLSIPTKTIYGCNIIHQDCKGIFFYWNRKSHSKIHMQPQKTLNTQCNPVRKEQSWMSHRYWLLTILQSWKSHGQRSLVFAIGTWGCKRVRQNLD